ncbi:MAG: PQQ-binding-like beta-propeller repeat protein [bacterium]|nr:PQQ-binding-like beta-propeller repeat protein [bacterium]
MGKVYPKRVMRDIWSPEAGKPSLINLRRDALLGFGSLLAALFIFVAAFVPRESILAGGLANSSWPKYGHDERNTARHSTFFTQTGDFGHAWTLNLSPYDAGVTFQGNPVLGSDGTIYVGGYAPSAPVYAITPEGLLKWRVTIGDSSQSGIDATIALDQSGNLIVPTPYGFFKLSSVNGSVVWSIPNLLSDGSSPTIAADGTIYTYGTGAGMPGAAFFALNPDGTIRWSIDLTAPSRGVPAIADDGTIYFSTQDGFLWALNSDSSVKWKYDLGQSATVSVLVGIDGTAYVAATTRLFAISPDGTLKWTYDASGDYIGNGLAEAVDGTIYFGTFGPPHSLFAVSSAGTLKWTYALASGVDGGVSVGGLGSIYVPSNESIYAISSSGEKHWQYDKPSEFNFSFYGTPIISTDGLYLFISSADDGTITALIPKSVMSARPLSLLSKPPIVTIEKPATGELLSAKTVIAYTAYDPDGTGDFGFSDNPISIDYSIDEGIIGTWKTVVYNSPNSSKMEFDTTNLPDGAEVFIRIVARDRVGLFDEKTAGPFLVDNQGPTFLVRAPIVKNSGFIDILVEASEALKDIVVYVDQAGRGKVLAPTTDFGDQKHFTARYEVIKDFDGVATVTISGTDKAGNTSNVILAGDRFSVFVTPPPKPVVLSPRNGDILSEAILKISGISIPGARVLITVNGTDQYEVKPFPNGTFSIAGVVLSTKNLGKNTIALVAEDAVGVSESLILSVIVNTPPKVTILLPRSGRILSDVVKFTWSAEDPNADKLRFSFAYSTNDGDTWLTTATDIAETSYAWDTTVAPDGPGVKVRITASDGIGDSYAIGGPYTLKNDLPIIKIDSPTSSFINTRTLDLKGQVRSNLYTISNLSYSFNQTDWTAIPAGDGSYNSGDELFSLLMPRQFPEGNIALYFRAQDSRKKYGYKEMVFTIDTQPPQKPSLVIRETPAFYSDVDDADIASEGLQVALRGTAEPLSNVLIFLGEKEMGRAATDREGKFLAVLTLPSHGVNEFQVFAEDRAMNRSTAHSFTITANNAPEFTLLWPGKNDFIGAKHKIIWEAKDRDGDTVADVTLSIRNPRARIATQRTWSIIAKGLKETSYTWGETLKFQSGDYELKLSGSDGYAQSELIAPIRIDSIAPSLQAALALPRRTNNPRIGGQGNAQDDFSGIEAVEFALNEEPFTKATLVRGYQSVTSAYRFAFPKELVDGDYMLSLRATDRAENISQTTSARFTIDTTPPHVGSWRIQQGPSQLFPEEDIVDMFGGASYAFSLALSEDAVQSGFRIGDTPFNLVKNPGGQLFQGHIEFEKAGIYPMHVEVADDLGNSKAMQIGTLRVIEPAYVVDAKTSERLANTRVSAYFFDEDAKTWRLWDGAAYGQTNPQTTQNDGAFRYFLPRGTYELRLSASGRKNTKTSQIVISKPTFLTLTVPLKKAGWWERVLQIFTGR